MGKHVNTAFSPSDQVWVVELDGVDVSPQNVPKGVTPKHYSHVAVVFDTASHHWIETHEW